MSLVFRRQNIFVLFSYMQGALSVNETSYGGRVKKCGGNPKISENF
jgi:hypothetical protein